MGDSILEDSWVYQMIFREGYKEGYQLGLELAVFERLLITYIAGHFPALTDLAKKQARLIKDVNTFQQVLNKIFYLQTAGEIEEYLLAVRDDTRNN